MTTAQQHDANRRLVISLVQALAKDKGVLAREPWTPDGLWSGNNSLRTFSADHVTCKAFGLYRFGGNSAAFEQLDDRMPN